MTGASGSRGARTARAALALAVLFGAGCSEAPAPEQPALVADAPDNVSTWGFTPTANEVLAVGTAPLRVLRPVTLESLSVGMERGELDLLDARVSLFACATCRERPGLVAYPGYAGSSCSTGPWPPKGFGPTYPLNGFEVAPGDRPSLVMYLRPRSERAKSRVLTLTYREGDETRRMQVRNELVEIEPPTTPDGDRCVDSIWFGSTTDPQHSRITSPSPTSGTAPSS